MTQPKRRRRGTGLKHTLPLIGRFAGLWMGTTVAAVAVAVTSALSARKPAVTVPSVPSAIAIATTKT